MHLPLLLPICFVVGVAEEPTVGAEVGIWRNRNRLRLLEDGDPSTSTPSSTFAPTTVDLSSETCPSESDDLVTCVRDEMSVVGAGLCLECLYRRTGSVFNISFDLNETTVETSIAESCSEVRETVCPAITQQCPCSKCRLQTIGTHVAV